ncbi:MAG: hypothetical protein ABIX01_08890 [Chitinophagaceae bacterium]
MKKCTFILGTGLLLLALVSCKKNKNGTGGSNNPVIISPAPLMDFGTATYRGSQGGLYAAGNNQRPAAHNTAGLSIAQSIVPLNSSGNSDPANGKILWISIGLSNTTQETSAFLSLMQSYANKNPKLAMMDGAVGGQDINLLNNASAPYWDSVYNRLTVAGFTPAQVQVIWFKEAEASPTDTAFASYPDALKQKYKSVVLIIKKKFPKVKLCYLSSRIYAGYATSQLNPEPYAWYSGWSVKRLIDDQVGGDASLNYAGAAPNVPWLAWGPYMWASGATPRSDGLSWLPADFQSDGTHPSNSGRQKVAQMLLQFFSTDETTKPWFLKP